MNKSEWAISRVWVSGKPMWTVSRSIKELQEQSGKYFVNKTEAVEHAENMNKLRVFK